MTLEIARRLGQDGVTWETVVVEEDTGGGIPDPSGEPDGDVLTVSSGAAVWSPGGGSQAVGCVLARDAPFDIHDAGSYDVLWDALYDNFWDLNPPAEIPGGLGLSFAFDGSSSLVVPTEAGIWTEGSG